VEGRWRDQIEVRNRHFSRVTEGTCDNNFRIVVTAKIRTRYIRIQVTRFVSWLDSSEIQLS
jgi:hypothetical protein